MSTGANISSIDALRSFRVALIKFIEHGNVALTSGESDVNRTLGWLEREQSVYWANQLRKRHDWVQQCEQALREKQIFKSFDGTAQSVVDEMKALAVAKRRRAEAEEKILAVKKSISLLRRESLLYKGRMQKLASTLQGDLPRAVHALGRMLARLDEYLAVQSTGGGLDLDEAIEQFTRMAAAPLEGNARLRAMVPTATSRAGAPEATDLDSIPVGTAAFPQWQLPLLDTLPRLDAAPAAEQRVTLVGSPVAAARRILQRCEPAFEQDTGWCLYPAEAPTEPAAEPALQTWPVWQLLRAAPELKPLMPLPTGWLVVFDEAGIVTVLDANGIDQWAAALSRSAAATAT